MNKQSNGMRPCHNTLSLAIRENLRVSSRITTIGSIACALTLGTLLTTTPLLADEFTVLNTNDAGADSLREAIKQSNSTPGLDTVVFDLPGGNNTIKLNSEYKITDQITISGPGVQFLTLDGNSEPNIFNIDPDGTQLGTASISGMTLSDAQNAGIVFDEMDLNEYNWGRMSLEDLIITNCGAGIINNNGALTMKQTSIIDNTGDGIRSHNGRRFSSIESLISGNGGDGVHLRDQIGNVYFYRNTFFNNDGTGINLHNVKNATISQSTITGNQHGGLSIIGAEDPLLLVLDARFRTTLERSLVSGNTKFGLSTLTDNVGGGIFVSAANLDIENSTVSGNTSGYGGGIATYFNAGLTIRHSTIAFNEATIEGGGIFSSSDAILVPPVQINHSLVVNNTAPLRPDIVTPPPLPNIPSNFGEVEFDWSIFTDTGDANLREITPGSSVNNTPFVLSPLQANSGPTLTHALLPGSPAINRGNPEVIVFPEFDQRGAGFPRVVGDVIDVGAYEFSDDNDDTIVFEKTVFNESDGTIKVNLTFPGLLSGISSLRWATKPGTATPGEDYRGTRGKIVLQDGESTASIAVKILNDDISEPDETLFVKFFSPMNITFEDKRYPITIEDDDNGAPVNTLRVEPRTVPENIGFARIRITLNRVNDKFVKVDYFTTAKTAQLGGDYLGVVKQVSFKPGETVKIVSVPIINDQFPEDTEFFNSNLVFGSNAKIIKKRAKVTIKDGD